MPRVTGLRVCPVCNKKESWLIYRGSHLVWKCYACNYIEAVKQEEVKP